MAASSLHKQNVLECIYWDALDDSLTLEAALKAYARARFSETKKGLVLTATSANGKSVQRQLPPGVSHVEASEIITELRRLREEVVAAFVSAAIASPTDAQVVAEMLARLAPIKHAVADFSTTADLATAGEVAS